MFLGVDHLVIAVTDPDGAAADLEHHLGLEATGGGRHEALGTFNRLVWLGDSYLELIGVFDRAVAEGSWVGAPTVRALDAGGGLATWAIASDALDDDVARLRSTGADIGEPISGERIRPDGTVVRWRLATPRHLGPADPPFLIEHDPTAAEWSTDDRTVRAEQIHPLGGPVRLETLELPVDDLNAAIQRFTRAAGLRFRPSLAGGGARDATVASQTVRLLPRRDGSTGAAMPAIRLTVAAPVEPRAAELLGCRWIVRATG
ncbi:MAG: VOC family protein [Candidatus Limnocylindrales bacterium]